ncbi:MAG: 50S ribosome-binding GTPase [Phycisphaerales bacterium]|nr:50S ribosome-binding GTPase [Phycisphaerales bacterium]
MSGPALDAVWRLQTAPWLPGALAIFQIRGDVSGALARLGLREVAPGAIALRTLPGVDTGILARVSQDLALITIHGGAEVIRRMSAALGGAGLAPDRWDEPLARFPEAGSSFRAAVLDALTRAASPRAVDLLLDQPRRWAAAGQPEPAAEVAAPDMEHSSLLQRLIVPPLVIALGASNIGKSTLLNRLAGRGVAIVADEPGTTRDHVGALVDLDGLVVRFMDTPGLRPDARPPERAALAAALQLLEQADLILLLGDVFHPLPEVDATQRSARSVLRVAIRADLGLPEWAADEVVSAVTGAGVEALTRRVRRLLVPDAVLEAETPWRFWSAPGS